MAAVFDKPSLLQRIAPIFQGFDVPLVLGVLIMAGAGLVTMYSVGFDHGARFAAHGRNMLIALGVLFLVAQVPPQRLMSLAVPLYLVGVALLVGVELFGIERKGAQRWLNVGVVIQPSELLKIAMPLMLAWWFQRREGQLKPVDFLVAFVLLGAPAALILKQPDLGTSLLVVASGLFVIFFAGLSWKLILPPLILGVVGVVTLIFMEEQWCAPGVDWKVLREYQRIRVCTLLDPFQDPLGKGFHIIQGMIAIGSGGVWGKGFMQGTQTHLEFIPERTTDFIYAAFSEEFGLVGTLALMTGFIFLVVRGLMIALDAPTLFTRLLAGALTLNIFVYAFVNMGMVSGILPVVG
ncbi:MAG TPA: rod shape-determining protein RodA, partial [Hydrogenophaga sp.]|nr:rod shape-determining protein RodA [Hydrogenophaga sp.]